MPKIVQTKIVQTAVNSYWSTSDSETVRLYWGDVIEILRNLDSRSVQMVVTSPPYWGLRNYRTETAEGDKQLGIEVVPDCLGWSRKENCASCYICKMVLVFRHENVLYVII